MGLVYALTTLHLSMYAKAGAGSLCKRRRELVGHTLPMRPPTLPAFREVITMRQRRLETAEIIEKIISRGTLPIPELETRVLMSAILLIARAMIAR